MGELDLILPGPSDPLAVLTIVEDFLTGSNTTGNVGSVGMALGGTFTLQASEAGHPGIARMDTGAVSSTIASLYGRVGATSGSVLPSETFDLTAAFRLNTNDADTRVRIGLASNFTTAAPNDGIYLEKTLTDTQWFGTCRASSVETRTAALASVDTSWHKVRIRRINASTIGFAFDGAAEVAVAATIPTVSVHFGLHIFNNAAASKTIDADLFVFKVTGLSR